MLINEAMRVAMALWETIGAAMQPNLLVLLKRRPARITHVDSHTPIGKKVSDTSICGCQRIHQLLKIAARVALTMSNMCQWFRFSQWSVVVG